MPRKPYTKDDVYMAREQFSDAVADIFAQTTKDQKVFYVGSVNGNASFSGRRVTAQVPTLAAAIALATASNGDLILIAPNHAETVSLVQSLNKIGLTVKGLKWGNQRPRFTINAAVDGFSLDAAGVTLAGIEFVCGTVDNVPSFVNLTAARCRVSDCYASDCSNSGSVNLVDAITVAAGADHCVIENNTIFNTTTALTAAFLSIEAAVNHLVVKGNRFFGDCGTAVLMDEATATQIQIEDNFLKSIGTNIPAVSLANNSTGFAIRNHLYGTDATIANDVNWGTALMVGENFVRGGTGSGVSATSIIPALDT